MLTRTGFPWLWHLALRTPRYPNECIMKCVSPPTLEMNTCPTPMQAPAVHQVTDIHLPNLLNACIAVEGRLRGRCPNAPTSMQHLTSASSCMPYPCSTSTTINARPEEVIIDSLHRLLEQEERAKVDRLLSNASAGSRQDLDAVLQPCVHAGEGHQTSP